MDQKWQWEFDMMRPTEVMGCLAVMAVMVTGPAAAAEPLSAEQIENALFAKSKAITPVKRKSLDMPAVTFEFDSARLTDQARQQLDLLGSVLAKHSDRRNKFAVAGHTDSVGSATYNENLSRKRAEAVTQYLVSRYGISRESMASIGYGESRLLPQIDAKDSRQRRAEIVNLGPGQ